VLNFTVLASGEGTVTGRVTDRDSPLPGATVSLRPEFAGDLPNRLAVTDATGNFRIPNVPAGVWNLSASAPGFPTGPDTQFTLHANETVSRNIDR